METCRNITEHVIQYTCSKCDILLSESDSTLCDLPKKIHELCPMCGSQLADTLQIKQPSLHQKINSHVQIQTAYKMNAKLTFDIEGIDRMTNLSVGDHVCIAGSRKHANLLLTRLWVRALMPQRHGGLASEHVLCIDAGNCANVYQCVSFARQYGMDVRRVLRSIILSRTFTIYQLAGVIVRRLPQLIQQFNAKIVVISDLLKMFVEDPTVKSREARYLLREIMKAINHLPRDVLVMVSLYNSPSNYDRLVQATFEKLIQIAQIGNEKSLLVRLFKNKHTLSEFSLPEMDLQRVSTK
jgi:hypothetical protein